MNDIQIFNDEFFEDEIRDGFYIPGMVKRGWAAELEVLREIDRICSKYDIEYFADWGSLLATVRHGGFIPWDDDLDITMKRSDYKKFLSHMDELPEGFEIINYHTNEDYWQFLSRIVGKKRICFEEDHLARFHQFPYICGVDIFILDYRSDDPVKENDRCLLAKYIIAVSDAIENGSLTGSKLEDSLKKIENLSARSLPRNLSDYDLRIKLYELCEDVFDMYNDAPGENITQLFPFGINNPDFNFPSKYYSRSIRLPYENTRIPVPLEYTKVLEKRYGDFMRLVKTWGGHDYPYFASQQKELEDVLDFEVPSFKFTDNLLKKAASPEGDTYKSLVRKYALALDEAVKELISFAASNERENVAQLCGMLQKSATDLGTLIEQWKGDGTKTVTYLEQFCEMLFEIYSGNYNEDELTNLFNAILSASDALINRREVVFLPFKADYFERFRPYYNEAVSDENTDVYVVPLPYYYKKINGTLHDIHYDINDYPENVPVTDYTDFNLAAHHPDIIYFQNPYDEWNDTTSLPKAFYSGELSSRCENLIYIPWFSVDKFTKDDAVPYTNTAKYVAMPGVLRADYIYLDAQWLKEIYIERLCDFAGEDTRKIWENKIKVKNNPSEKPVSNHKKIIAYSPNISVVSAYGDKIVEKISSVLDIFYENKNDITLLWFEDDLIEKELSSDNPELYEKYKTLADEFKAAGWGIYDTSGDIDALVKKCDAFYGDAGHIAHLFRMAQKPVMIENPEIT